MHTLDYQAALYDISVDPVMPTDAALAMARRVYVFWHEYILFPVYLRGNCNVGLLLSRHRDAEWLAQAARLMGYRTLRGSTYRGARTALRELLRRSGQMHLGMTPDGPRGPRRRLSPGPIYLSSKLRIPLVALGLGYDRPWRLRTWDQFAIPRPGSRARAILSPAMQMPHDLDRQGLEHYRQQVEKMLNRLTLEAEAWAEASTRKIDQIPLRRQPAPRGAYRRHGPKRRPVEMAGGER